MEKGGRNMKRMIVCALALVLSFSLFGCGSKPAEEFVDETLNEISYQVPIVEISQFEK